MIQTNVRKNSIDNTHVLNILVIRNSNIILIFYMQSKTNMASCVIKILAGIVQIRLCYS